MMKKETERKQEKEWNKERRKKKTQKKAFKEWEIERGG